MVIILMLLTMSIKSQAQETETCYTPKQVSRINDYAKGCEKCRLDLTDTMLALKDARNQAGASDHSLTVVVGVLSLLIGAAIGSQLK